MPRSSVRKISSAPESSSQGPALTSRPSACSRASRSRGAGRAARRRSSWAKASPSTCMRRTLGAGCPAALYLVILALCRATPRCSGPCPCSATSTRAGWRTSSAGRRCGRPPPGPRWPCVVKPPRTSSSWSPAPSPHCARRRTVIGSGSASTRRPVRSTRRRCSARGGTPRPGGPPPGRRSGSCPPGTCAPSSTRYPPSATTGSGTWPGNWTNGRTISCGRRSATRSRASPPASPARPSVPATGCCCPAHRPGSPRPSASPACRSTAPCGPWPAPASCESRRAPWWSWPPAGSRSSREPPAGWTALRLVGRDLESVRQDVREGALGLHPPPVGRVLEAEPYGVQPLPYQAEPRRQRRIGAVREVTRARVVDGRHVHPDLVGTAGLQLDVEQADRAERLDTVVVRHRGTAARDAGPPSVAGGVPVDRGVDGAPQRIRQALDEGVVALVDGAFLEGPLEQGVGRLALGHDHRAGGVGVETVDDALALGRAAGGDRVPGAEPALQHGGPGHAGGRMGGAADRLD